jgi:hypothetical protein
MTVISTNSVWQPSQVSRSGVNQARSESPPVARLTASSIVKFGAQNSSSLLYSASGAAGPKEAERPRDVAGLLAANVLSDSAAGRFSGLGAALLGQLAGESTGGKLDVSAGAGPAAMNGLAAAGSAMHGVGDDRIALTITTSSGTEVSLKLDSRPGGLAVQMTSSGELSEAERGALAGLADAFQDAIDGFAKQPPQVRLEGLTKFDSSVLASVDLRAVIKFKNEPGSTQTLEFKADAAKREVSLSGPSGSATVSVDTSKLAGLGSAERQATAVGSYLKQFDQAAARGHGDAALVSMFKEAFAGMHSNIGAAPSPGGFAASAVHLEAEDHAAMTGLADFSAAITQTPDAVNPMRPAELDNFAYQVSQETSVGGRSQADRSISQQQKSQLRASYHTPSVPGAELRLGRSAESQNYNYHEIDDAASSTVSVGYKDGLLVKAILQQSSRQSARVLEYSMGKLTSDTTTPGRQQIERDVLAALSPHEQSEGGLTDEKRRDERLQLLASLSGQVLLQAYPNGVSLG